jgi:hypothetical protein
MTEPYMGAAYEAGENAGWHAASFAEAYGGEAGYDADLAALRYPDETDQQSYASGFERGVSQYREEYDYEA